MNVPLYEPAFLGSVRKACGYVMLIFESVLSLQLDFKQHVNLSNSRYLYANSALSLGYLEMPMYSALPCRTMSTSV